MHVKRSGIMGMDFVLLRYFHGLLYFLYIIYFRQLWDIGRDTLDMRAHSLQWLE